MGPRRDFPSRILLCTGTSLIAVGSVFLSACTFDAALLDQKELPSINQSPSPGTHPFGERLNLSGPLCTNGYIRSTTQAGSDRIILGGDFSIAGVCSGNALPFSKATQELSLPLPQIPKVDGQIYQAVSDGAGGWYVVGDFTQIGGQARQHLARILADGSVAAIPNVTFTTSTPRAIALSSNHLFVGGVFTQINGVARPYLAALDRVTGNLDPWNPNPNAYVESLAMNSTKLYVGGNFTTISGQARKALAAYDLGTLTLEAWPAVDACNGISCSVRALSVSDSYVAFSYGNWSSLSPATKVIDASTGLNVNLVELMDSPIKSTLVKGSHLYLGGEFNSVAQRSYGKRIDLSTGLEEIMTQTVGDLGGIRAVVPDGAGGYFIGGSFNRVGASGVNKLARLNSQGEYISAVAGVTGTSSNVRDLEFDGSRLIVAGTYTNLAGNARTALGAVDSSGTFIPTWTPSFTATGTISVQGLELTTNYLAIFGNFNTVNGQARAGFAVFNRSDWSLNTLALTLAGGTISEFDSDGDVLYLVGSFTSVNGQARNRIAAIDLTTGTVLPFNPGANSTVSSVTVSTDRIYFGGLFTEIEGQAQELVAAYDRSTLNRLPFRPFSPSQMRFNSEVVKVQEVGGKIILQANTIQNGFQIEYLWMGFDKLTGLQAWSLPGNFGVFVAAESGGTNYFGTMNTWGLGGHKQRNLARWDLTTGRFDPSFRPDFDGAVMSFADEGTHLYVGGEFKKVNGTPQAFLAKLDIATAALSPGPQIKVDGLVSSLSSSAQDMMVVGEFSTYGGYERPGVLALDLQTRDLTSWKLDLGYETIFNPFVEVFALTTSSKTLFVGGDFNRLNGQFSPPVVGVDLQTGLPRDHSWAPSGLEGYVAALLTLGDRIFAGGEVTSDGGTTDVFLFEINDTTWTMSPSPLNIDDQVLDLAVHGDHLFLGGYFSDIDGQSRFGLASLNLSTNSLSSWNPQLGNWSYVYDLELDQNRLYVGGYINGAQAQTRDNFVAFLLSDLSLDSLALNTDSDITKIVVHQNRLYFSGWFDGVNLETQMDGFAIYDLGSSSFVTPTHRPSWPEFVGRVGDWLFVSAWSYSNQQQGKAYLGMYDLNSLLLQ